MKRREAMRLLFAISAIGALPSHAQQAAKVHRVGFLSSESAHAWAPRIEALRVGLRELGYIEGRNLVIEYRWAEGKYERLGALAGELAALRPEVIVAGAAPASRAAKQATSTIPVVMVAVGDVVEFGLVTNLSRPGSNLTGSTFFNLELSAKRIELFKEVLPQLRRLALLLNPESVGSDAMLRAMTGAAESLKIVLRKFEVTRTDAFVSSFAAIAKERFEAVAIPNQPIMNTNIERIAALAGAHQLASIGGAEFAEAGCLLGYGINFPDLYHRAAVYVDKILKGARPGEMPVERATRFDLVVNSRTAKALGITIPPSILLRADRVIE